MEGEITFIPERLNQQPVIFMGFTDSELKSIGGFTLLFWLPLCAFVAWLFGQTMVGVGVGAALSFVTLWALGKKLSVIKRGKPKGYHVLLMTAWLEDHRLKSKSMLRRDQVWSIRRKK